MKIKYEGKIYDVVDTYSAGVIIEKERNGYRYSGYMHREVEIIDASPIEYVKSKKYLAPKKTEYSKTKFIDQEFYSGTLEVEEDTITVYQNVVMFYSPGRHDILVLDIKKTKRTENGKYVWGFEKHEDNTISLSPSIRFTTPDHHSEHFFIKRNKVVNWCRDSWEKVYVKKDV